MRVCIPIPFQPHGGGYYFLSALSSYLLDQGWSVTEHIRSGCDLLFTNHWMVPRSKILRAIRCNPKIRVVQRIDGAAQDYGRYDQADFVQHEVNCLADLTIFQSHYCRYSTKNKFSVIVHDGPVIHNPVNIELFCPEGPRLSFPEDVRIACITWSTNPLKGAESIYEVARCNPDIGFILCGRYPDMPNFPNLHFQGVLGRQELARVLRSCHVLLTFSQNEACPNHVLEALASGLPVLYHDSGSMEEVIGKCGLPVTIENFSEQLERVMARRAELSVQARERVLRHFHPQHIFRRYLEVMQVALKRPTAVNPACRLWIAWSEPIRWSGLRVAKALRSRSTHSKVMIGMKGQGRRK